MQAVILAGGKGTRLAERLNGKPKPLIDVLGVPLLQRQIEALSAQGVREFVVLVNHAADQIVAFLDRHEQFGCDVRVVDDGEPKGTAGAVLACLDQLRSRFVVVYGDTYFSIELSRMLDVHEQSGAAGTLFLHPNDHPHDSDLVELDDNDNIVAFHGYPHPPGAVLDNQVNAAFYILERDLLLPWRGDSHGIFDFGKDLFPKMAAANVRLHGYRSFEYIKDLGTPARLDKVERDLREGRVARSNVNQRQACVFVDRDGTLNAQRGYVRLPEQLSLIPGAAFAVRRLNETGYRVAVVTNQPVVARGEVTFEGLRRIHDKLASDLGAEGAFVDRIYFCPHHPDGGFAGERSELKIACQCRKPMTGLLAAAASDLNADLINSWVIGDSTADILAAERFGVASILVGTGEGGRDGKWCATPSFTAGNMAEAASFILDGYPKIAMIISELCFNIGAGDIILVGGLARTGKSTVSAAMARELRRAGLKVSVISLDRWILPEELRAAGVVGRFELDSMAADLAEWLRGGACDIVAPFYDRSRRRRIYPGPAIQMAPDSVLILEGVPALLSDITTMRAVHRVFVRGDEAQRAKRVIADLEGRQLAKGSAAREVYEDRMRDEYPVVVESERRADHRLSLDEIWNQLGAPA